MLTEQLRGRAPEQLIERWSDQAESLTEIQRAAVEAGVLSTGGNYLVMAPTSSGKTLVGEMAATTAAYTRRGSSVFLVPYRALADEHFYRFRERYRDLVAVAISTGDWSEFDPDISRGNFGLAVMTYEKLAALLVDAPGLLRRINCVVVDEVQMLGEPERGARLELLLTQLLASAERPQIVALSASLDHLNNLDRWLDARLVASSERPVALQESVVGPAGGALVRRGPDVTEERQLPPHPDAEAIAVALAVREVGQGRQALIFRTSIAKTQDTASAIAQRLPAIGIPDRLARSLNDIEESDVTNLLRRTLSAGVGVHNADMTTDERRLVEDAFRLGEARALVSTTTLAMGVNLPTDSVIVADTRRFMPHPLRGWQSTNISVAEYRNCAGRAGRLGLRSAGTSFVIAENDDERRQLFDYYVLGETEIVESQIPRRPFTDLVFEVVTGRDGCTAEDIVAVVARTFAYTTFYERYGSGLDDVRTAVQAAVEACLEAGLLDRDAATLFPTATGLSLARHGLSFESAITLGSAIRAEQQSALTRAEVYHTATANRDTGTNPYVRRQYGQPVDPRPTPAAAHLTTSRPDSPLAITLASPRITEAQGHALVKLSCVLDFTEGMPYSAIARRYSGGAPSRVAALGRNVAWQVQAIADSVSGLGATPERVGALQELVLEARYGVPAAAANLARLRVPGIPRESLAQLATAGLADPDTALMTEPNAFEPILTAMQVSRLKAAIIADAEDTQARRKAGQIARLERTSIPARIVEAIYSASGGALEQAVTDALQHLGFSAQRIFRQPHGEADIHLAHPSGLVVISVTASDSAAKKISWAKSREILGAGAGHNPINFICVGRPDFDDLALRRAKEIAAEVGSRSILLVPASSFAEAFVRVTEGRVQPDALLRILGEEAGVLEEGRLDAAEVPPTGGDEN